MCSSDLKMPAQSASFSLDNKDVDAREKIQEQHCEKVQEARDLSRHAIGDSPDRASKNVILNFPMYMKLSNTIYSPDQEGDGEISMSFTPYKGEVTLAGKKYATMNCRIAWTVHLVEAKDRIVEKLAVKKNAEAELARLLEKGMNMMDM